MENSKISQEHSITVQRTARYYTLGNFQEDDNQTVWWVCHGYGQLARFFIKHFEPLIENENAFVIAPEGLSRFYLGDNYERVGASWMTKENRLDEISDQILFLNQVFESYFPPKTIVAKRKWIALGFSQGTATIWRWLSKLDSTPDALVLWAGMIPYEFEKIAPKVKAGMKLFFVFGTQDPFITAERIEALKLALAETNLPYHLLSFEGEHTLDKETLLKINEMSKI